MLTRCIDCGFYVKKDDEFCPNCGTKSPLEEYPQLSPKLMDVARYSRSKLLFVILSAIFTFLLFFLITGGDFSEIAYLRDYILFAIILSGIGVTALSMFLINKWAVKKLRPQRLKNYNNFTSRKNTIKKRLSELDKRTRTIDSVLSKIDENSSDRLRAMRSKLLSAREIVLSQFARYELQSQKIELARLQNGVAPFLYGLHRLNEFETENALVTVENMQTEIGRIRQNLTRHDAIDFPPPAQAEKNAFLSQLEETKDSCGTLRDALLSRQAARALHDISPVEENLKIISAKEIMRETEVFNIQTMLTDFSDSFEELEHEYQRLKAEEETGQKLLVE